MEYVNKIVDFGTYCKQCEHFGQINQNEENEVCEECLKTRANEHSKKPEFFIKGKTDERGSDNA